MQVRITNVTDGPGKRPMEVRVYSKKLRPGAWMDVPIQFVDDKVRKLEQSGAIIIGKLPSWYADYENRRKVRNLTNAEVVANVEVKKKAQAKALGLELKVPAPPEPLQNGLKELVPREEESSETKDEKRISRPKR